MHNTSTIAAMPTRPANVHSSHGARERVGVSDLGKLDAGDWLGVIVTSVLAGLGAAMGWFKSSNKKRDQSIEELGERMNNYEAVRATQATQLAVLQTCQANIEEKLGDIKDEIERTAMRGAHSVNEQIAQLVVEVQKVVAHQQRRP